MWLIEKDRSSLVDSRLQWLNYGAFRIRIAICFGISLHPMQDCTILAHAKPYSYHFATRPVMHAIPPLRFVSSCQTQKYAKHPHSHHHDIEIELSASFSSIWDCSTPAVSVSSRKAPAMASSLAWPCSSAVKVQKAYLLEDLGKSEMFMVVNRTAGTT